MYRVDLNSDLGESYGAYTLGRDNDILQYVTSANIACGFHAGDPDVMEKTVRLAAAAGVRMGSHPGYPDLQGFGRRNMKLTNAEASASVLYQTGALFAFLAEHGQRLQHVKLHGALYNTAAKDYALSLEICHALASAFPDCIFVGLAGSDMLRAAQDAGLRTASEVFADRAYNDDGSLVSRSLPGAVLHDRALAVERTVRMITDGTVESVNGKTIPIRADTVCVHGDNESALEFVRAIRAALTQAGVEIRPLGE